jgi:uncharacterized membrane protein
MKKQVYFACLAGIIGIMILGLGFGLVSANPVIPALIIITGIIAVYACHRRVTDVMNDDLTSAISGKAALAALQITIIVAAILFAGAMTFYFNGGYGGGFHTYNNGSVQVWFMQFDTIIPGQNAYKDTYYIQDPISMTTEDYWGLDRLFAKGHQQKDFPLAFGTAMGGVVVLLVSLYAAFSIYYNRKYEE